MQGIKKYFFTIFFKIITNLKLYKITRFTKVYDNGWWVKNPLKIIILGSSFAKCHIIPKVIQKINPIYKEKEIANFAQSMGAPFEMYISLVKNKQYLKELDYVYIGIDPHILGEKFYHYMLVEKQFINYKQWEYLFTNNAKYMEVYHPKLKLNIFSPFHSLKEMFMNTFRKSSKYNGYEARRILGIKRFNENDIKEYTYGDLNLFPVSKFSIYYLQRIQNFINKHTNAKIIYFLSPSYDWQIGYEKNCKEYDSQLCDLISKYLGEVSIKGSLFKESFKLNEFDFSDNRHLSHLGAVKFTKALFNDIDPISHSKIQPLYSYKNIYYINEEINIFNDFLKIFKEELKLFLLDKTTVLLYGFNNVSRIISSLVKDSKATFYICDKNQFLGSLPSYLEDTFIRKKKLIHFSKTSTNNFNALIITDLTNYKKERESIERSHLHDIPIYNPKNKELDFNFLHLQINLLFNLLDKIENKFSHITLIGNSILKDFIIERFRNKELNIINEVKKEMNINHDEIIFILDNITKNKNILINQFNINQNQIISIDI